MIRNLAWALVAGLITGGFAVASSGCIASGPDNPRFLISNKAATEDRQRMQAAPVRLDRPIVVLGGYHGPNALNDLSTRKLRRLTSGNKQDFETVSFWFTETTEEAVERAVTQVGERFGTSEDGTETVEVDVVGISMGGLIARAAAIPADGRPTLRVRRMFTITTPHRGADLATRVAPDDAARALQPGSDFIAMLNEAYDGGVTYDLIPYGVLNDGIVGVVSTAPPGELPIWTRGKIFGSHLTAHENERILLDIARRLRGEMPIAQRGEPLPTYH